MVKKKKTIIIKRFHQDRAVPGWEESYTVPAEGRATVLQSLLYIYENLDSTLAFEYSCRYAKCGLCGVEVNGRPGLACTAFLNNDQTLVGPLANLPVIRDLVVDRSPLDRLLKDQKIFFSGTVPDESPGTDQCGAGDCFPLLEVPEGLKKLLSCVECFSCHAACPNLDYSDPALNRFAGPLVFLKLAQLHLDPRDQKNRKSQARRLGIEQCATCRRCYCPIGIPIYNLAIKPFLG